ncbi:MAG: hcnA 2 [Ramlibacter sp.]|nr:hcnA 2 [Ramlibacter sp.]
MPEPSENCCGTTDRRDFHFCDPHRKPNFMNTSLFRKLDDAGAKLPALSLTIDGQTVNAEPGDSVAAVLLRLDPPLSRTTPVRGSSRAPYCMMGVCFECLAIVDGVASTQTCLIQVQHGMFVERQHGRRQLTNSCPAGESIDECEPQVGASKQTLLP